MYSSNHLWAVIPVQDCCNQRYIIKTSTGRPVALIVKHAIDQHSYASLQRPLVGLWLYTESIWEVFSISNERLSAVCFAVHTRSSEQLQRRRANQTFLYVSCLEPLRQIYGSSLSTWWDAFNDWWADNLQNTAVTWQVIDVITFSVKCKETVCLSFVHSVSIQFSLKKKFYDLFFCINQIPKKAFVFPSSAWMKDTILLFILISLCS